MFWCACLSAHAGLLVVGTREPIQGALPGGLHQSLLHQLRPCPVVTVPAVLAHAAPEPSGENSRHDQCA
jgi:hypothetical protein